MKTLSVLCLALVLASPIMLSGQPVVQELEKYLASVKLNQATPLPSEIIDDFKNEKPLLEALFRHSGKGDDQFQFRVLDMIRMIGLKSKNKETRMLAVSHIVKTISNKNLRVSGFASHAVTNFFKTDFSTTDADSILRYLRPGMPNLDLLFKLAGYLEHPAAKDRISSLLIQPISPTAKWNARLALSRLGDDRATDFIIDKISSNTIDDAFVYSLVPGLIYTRNKRIYQQLERYLQSDEYVCSSSHPDSKQKILCAYRILENVAGTIDKFPLRVDESGDLETDNYKTALVSARSWLMQNPDYTINRQTM